MSSVGIYMPCFNVENYINESILSILNQTHSDWELAIIDDCSTDNTFEVASEFIKKYDNKISIYKRDEHCGRIGQIKNEAINKLSNDHEYICHVGSDDMIPEYCFKTFVDYLNSNPEIGACCGNFICFDDSGKTWTLPHVANSGDYDSNILLQYMSMFPMRFYRKSIVDSVGGYSNELTSAVDYDLALKIDEITKIHRIKDVITYQYRQHSQQISTRERPEQNLNAKKALENALKRRNIDAKVMGDQPPFKLENNDERHFIWGKK